MRASFAGLSLAVLLLVAGPGAAAQGDAEAVQSSELAAFFDTLLLSGPLEGAARPVETMQSRDPVSGEPVGDDAPLAEGRPASWGGFYIPGEPHLPDWKNLLDPEDPRIQRTPGFDEALTSGTAPPMVVFVKTTGPVARADGYGFNFNFDTDPAANGRRMDGSTAITDCAVDVFVAGDERSLSTSKATAESPDFAEVQAPLLSVVMPEGAIMILPDGHPCRDARCVTPSFYGIQGNRAVEHSAAGADTYPMPLDFPTFVAAAPAADDAPAADGGEGADAGGSAAEDLPVGAASETTGGPSDGVLAVAAVFLATSAIVAGILVLRSRRGGSEGEPVTAGPPAAPSPPAVTPAPVQTPVPAASPSTGANPEPRLTLADADVLEEILIYDETRVDSETRDRIVRWIAQADVPKVAVAPGDGEGPNQDELALPGIELTDLLDECVYGRPRTELSSETKRWIRSVIDGVRANAPAPEPAPQEPSVIDDIGVPPGTGIS